MKAPQIPLFRVSMPPRGELMPRLEQVLYSGMIGEGEEVRRFEERFGAGLGGRPVLSFSWGTAALHAALMMAGVRAGDEVISTDPSWSGVGPDAADSVVPRKLRASRQTFDQAS